MYQRAAQARRQCRPWAGRQIHHTGRMPARHPARTQGVQQWRQPRRANGPGWQARRQLHPNFTLLQGTRGDQYRVMGQQQLDVVDQPALQVLGAGQSSARLRDPQELPGLNLVGGYG